MKVVITTFDLDEYVYGALKAGARGFLLKDAGADLLAQAIRAVTVDSVHDLGGHFPNWAIYGPVCDYMVKEHVALSQLSLAAER